ncbi:unannotated protein [freshwater metagenome]|uniref:Unannotated protein n=1 Tax=freshwater metagenome TaxID=449393 RepID=A0A6J7AUL9_9ZZZZ
MMAVPRADLVRVLPVTKVLGPVERVVQRGGQRVGVVASGDTINFVEPRDDGRVVGRGVRERLAGERPTHVGTQLTVRAQLVEHARVVGRIDEHADVRVVLRCAAHHGGPADVDELDAGLARERVEVHRDETERLDAVRGEVDKVRLVIEVGEDAAVHLGMQRHHAMAEHDRRTGHRRHILHRYPGRRDRARGASRGDQLPTQLDEPLGELDDA